MTNQNPNKNRIQLYLKDIHRYIIEEVRKENDWDDTVPERDIILYIMVEYERLRQKENKENKQLQYIDKHTTMILDLVASMCSEMDVPQRPLEDCLSYFEAKEYMESLMNNRRSIRLSQSVKRILQTPKAMRVANQMATQMHHESITSSVDNPEHSVTDLTTHTSKKPLGSSLEVLFDKNKNQSTTHASDITIDELTINASLENDRYKNTLD